MRVLQLGFDGMQPHDYQPHAFVENCVCYTGTHDNSPTPLWVKEASDGVREYTEKYFGVSNSAELVAAMIRGGMGSVARLFVAQLQDHLGLAEGSRVNIPGQPYGNWQWRLDKNTDLFAIAPALYEQARLYARI